MLAGGSRRLHAAGGSMWLLLLLLGLLARQPPGRPCKFTSALGRPRLWSAPLLLLLLLLLWLRRLLLLRRRRSLGRCPFLYGRG